jgi:hypothetical protein
MSLQVDRIENERLFWSGNYVNPGAREYQTLEEEANLAVRAIVIATVSSHYHYCCCKNTGREAWMPNSLPCTNKGTDADLG